jgi:hypothetical protein
VVGRELRRLDRSKKLEVLGWDRKPLMRATWTRRAGVKLEHAVHYPFIKGEVYGNDGETVDLFVRNGVLLSKSGEVITRGVVTYMGGHLDEG